MSTFAGVGRTPMTLLAVPDHEDPAHSEDPAAILLRGGLEINWRDGAKTNQFSQVPVPRVDDDSLQLPTLYLHLLDDRFKLAQNEFDTALRSGNDNSEMQLVVPEMYTGSDLPSHGGGDELQDAINRTLAFLKNEAMPPVSAVATKGGGFSPKKNYMVAANPRRWYFSLKTSRPKADISLPKQLFGIPEDSDMYLFAENHTSVPFMSPEQLVAFETCVNDLAEEEGEWKPFATFVKIFYEGGFAYNKKVRTEGAYLPRMAGLAALGTAPFFEDQSGITTGRPYLVRKEFLNFSDSVPVTIGAIKEMSQRHARYGLCFTRCVWVWEDDEYQTSRKLKFCSILPHGGFYYVPGTLREFNEENGLVYAFGETGDDSGGGAGAGLGQDAVEGRRA